MTDDGPVSISLASPPPYDSLDLNKRSILTVSASELPCLPESDVLRSYLVEEQRENRPAIFPSAMHLLCAFTCKDTQSVRNLVKLDSFDPHIMNLFVYKGRQQIGPYYSNRDGVGVLARYATKITFCKKVQVSLRQKLRWDSTMAKILRFVFLSLVRRSNLSEEFVHALRESRTRYLYYQIVGGYNTREGAKSMKDGKPDGDNLFGRVLMLVRSQVFNLPKDTESLMLLHDGDGLAKTRDTGPAHTKSPSASSDQSPESCFRCVNQPMHGFYFGEVCFPRCLRCYSNIAGPEWERLGPTLCMLRFCGTCELAVKKIEERVGSEKFSETQRDALAKFYLKTRSEDQSNWYVIKRIGYNDKALCAVDSDANLRADAVSDIKRPVYSM